MTEPRDDDFEPVPGAEELPDDVRDGNVEPGEDDPQVAEAPADMED